MFDQLPEQTKGVIYEDSPFILEVPWTSQYSPVIVGANIFGRYVVRPSDR
jgi:hypothetical protein